MGYQSGIMNICDSYNKGNITINANSSVYTGGLIGYGSGTYDKCYNEADINVTSTGTTYLGGLVGYRKYRCCNKMLL